MYVYKLNSSISLIQNNLFCNFLKFVFFLMDVIKGTRSYSLNASLFMFSFMFIFIFYSWPNLTCAETRSVNMPVPPMIFPSPVGMRKRKK